MADKTERSAFKSITLVSLQFICLGILFLSGPLLADPIYLLVPELAGLALGVWAVMAMGWGNLNIAPDPLQWSRLVALGPYRVIRHPMYLALLLVSLPVVVDSFSLFRFGVWLILLGTLIYKMGYEESMLLAKFPLYGEYRQRTSRLIPGLY
ncbi:MAG: methyltransferase family protein [Anaerolineales bacterium]|jgi:protein-S-isoprenylcysteine O-methyltransferase Ste14